ncbi:lambda-exonuclease family protein [uncultured Corynebacterium sp.]|uniref:YqaJ viral recombinase family nuclease n=1 Tax=uncultured Corynebacterium sp. TaxID=159447 RepID=UPI00262D8B8F|nr:YqaJ viral recombinase family protein [uncultured Corynebacterium sp.]
MPLHPNTVTVLPETRDRYDWLEQRRHGIGSSDASVIAGVGYEKGPSPYTIWLEKTGRVPLDVPVDPETAEMMEWGNILEPVIRSTTAERLGVQIDKPEQAWAHKDYPWLRANLDGMIAPNIICEFKNTSARNAKQWADQIPDHAEVQVHHAGLVTGWREAVVAGLIGGNSLSIHRVELNPNILEMLWKAEQEFWNFVETDTEPPIEWHESTKDALATEWRQSRTIGTQEVEEQDARKWVEQYHQAQADYKDAEKRKREATNHLLKLMAGHDQIATGDTIWAKTQRGRLNEKRLQAEKPDLYAKYLTRLALATDRLKADHPDVYADYQHISINPQAIA